MGETFAMEGGIDMAESALRPMVSVIMPVYNAERFLEKSLGDILNQTLRDIEIICVDDGSTDRSMEILKTLQSKDSRIRILHKEHSDAGDTRNVGMAAATGKYLSFLDADDLFYPQMLEKCVARMERDDADIVVYAAEEYNMLDETVTPMPRSLRIQYCPEHLPFHPSEMADSLLIAFQNWPWNKMFRREFIAANNIRWQRVSRHNDMAFVAQALTRAQRITLINESMMRYRVGTGTSLQSTNTRDPLAFWDAFLETRDRLVADGLYSLYEQCLLNNLMSGMMHNLNTVKGTDAYRRLRDRIIDRGEADFGFMNHPRSYYFYNSHRFDRYVRLLECGNAEVKVSIVIPTCNSAVHLRECVESALNQTLREIEVICVDGGSTDATMTILQEYARKDQRMQIFCAPENSYGVQMNMGIQAARGEYMAILEATDWLRPEMCGDLYARCEEKELEMIRVDYTAFSGEGENRKYTYTSVIPEGANVPCDEVINPSNRFEAFKCTGVIWNGLYSLAFLKASGTMFHETPGVACQDISFWFLTMVRARRGMYLKKDYYMLRRDQPDAVEMFGGNLFCICDEYDYIHGELEKEPAVLKRYAPVCTRARFRSCEQHYQRIDDIFKDAFLARFSADFKRLMALGEIHGQFFDMEQSFRLRMLVDGPDSYKYYRIALENWKWDCRENGLQQDPVVKKAVSLRKKQAALKRMLKKKGMRYVLRQILEKLHLAKHREPVRDYEFYSELRPEYYRGELQRWYKESQHCSLNLNYPKTFNEKLQWMKLYDCTALKAQLADRYMVREWVIDKIGEEYLMPFYGVWDSFDEIDFDQLPDQFVLKTSNFGAELKVENKKLLDCQKARELLKKWLAVNRAFTNGLELQYLNIPRKIFAEAIVDSEQWNAVLVDCFNDGEPEIRLLPDKGISETAKRELLRLAQILAWGFAFAEVGFYVNAEGGIRFRSMDFSPESGLRKMFDAKEEMAYGEKIRLPLRSPVPVKKK